MYICIHCTEPYDDDGDPTCLCVDTMPPPPMQDKQSRSDSVIEAMTNIMIGAGVALIAQLVWFPLIGKEFSFLENLATTAFFTLVSFIRSYGVRRLFNGRSVYQYFRAKL